jgi:GTP cyclohydrolase I
MKITGAKSVIVGIEECHLCMMMRVVQKQNSKTLTQCILGNIKCENIFKI